MGILKYKVALLLVFISLQSLIGQNYQDSIDVKLNGFIKADYIFDTHQIVGAREGLFLLYPRDNSDPDQDQSSYNQYALTSRLRTNVEGPDIWGATSKAAIEADFSGVTNADIDGFRLRHAYFRLDWKNTSMLFGQYWHPMTVPEAFPKPLSLNTGAPFHAFSRHPQFRISHQIEPFKIIGVVSTQRDYSNIGPEGYTPDYMIKGGFPSFHGQLHFQTGNWTFGIGGEYKAIAPALQSKGIGKKLKSAGGLAFAKLETKNSRLVLEAVYGENLYDQLMMGGYTLFDYDSVNNSIGMRNEPVGTIWADYTYRIGNDWSAGCFAGYGESYFKDTKPDEDRYIRGEDIDYVYRISPRIIKNIKNLTAGIETEYTVAAYNNTEDKNAENLRVSLIMLYHF